MKLRKFYVKSAFLNGDLKKNIYMEQPEGSNDDSDRILKLKNSLYGLKHASKD